MRVLYVCSEAILVLLSWERESSKQQCCEHSVHAATLRLPDPERPSQQNLAPEPFIPICCSVLLPRGLQTGERVENLEKLNKAASVFIHPKQTLSHPGTRCACLRWPIHHDGTAMQHNGAEQEEQLRLTPGNVFCSCRALWAFRADSLSQYVRKAQPVRQERERRHKCKDWKARMVPQLDEQHPVSNTGQPDALAKQGQKAAAISQATDFQHYTVTEP